MKNLKSFAERHPFSITLLGSLILIMAGNYLSKFNHLWLLLNVFAILLFLLMFFSQINKDWVCTKCGEEAIVRRYKFCSTCGGLMRLKKKEKRFCPRNHRISKYDKFCPKCGVSLTLITGRMR